LAKWFRSMELAQFLFPLVMMCQIVLSVHVWKPSGYGLGLGEAYGHFSWRKADNGRPSAAAFGSYLTLSRFGDIALRTIAYERREYERFIGRRTPDPTARRRKIQ